MEDYALMPADFAEPQRWTRAGYALVLVDVRGTGASYGEWSILWSDQEIADLGEVVDWIIAQPWSNGNVGAYGVSYDGSTAEMLSMLNHPAVKAVAPQSNELDLYTDLAYPGGIMNENFIREWSEFHSRLGANDVCGIAKAAKMDCEQMKAMMSGVRQVDNDLDGSQVAAAVDEPQAHGCLRMGFADLSSTTICGAILACSSSAPAPILAAQPSNGPNSRPMSGSVGWIPPWPMPPSSVT